MSEHVQPSMLPNQPQSTEALYIVRLRLRLHAANDEIRQLKRTITQLRMELQTCRNRMARKKVS